MTAFATLASGDMRAAGIMLVTAGVALGAAVQRPESLQPRKVSPAEVVAFDGTELLRRHVRTTQLDCAVHVDFDLVAPDGSVVARAVEKTTAIVVGGSPNIVRSVLLDDRVVPIGFPPVEGEPTAWLRDLGAWRAPEHLTYSAVRRSWRGTLVIDQLAEPWARTTIVAKDWRNGFLEAFSDDVRVVDRPSEEILRRAREEGGSPESRDP
ncbi:MAG: hypothetical protein AAF957_17565 [Planctomycetota bacterium]